MIEMDMSEKNEIERCRCDGKRRPIPFAIISLLIEAAVDEKANAGRLDKGARPRDLSVGTEELDSQALSLREGDSDEGSV